MKINLSEILKENSGIEIINYDSTVVIEQFNHDSRSIVEGEFFLPIIGDLFDGHDYIVDALDKGCVGSICQRDRLDSVKDVRKPIIVVETIETGLVMLAKVIRHKITVPVIGMTGSVGKSITRRMISSILDQEGSVLSTDKSNTLWGNIRLMMSYTNEDYVVLELGIDRLKEMEDHCNGSLPDIGALLNIGQVHAGPLGGVENVFKTKREIADYCIDEKKPIILNMDDKNLRTLSKEVPEELLVTVGQDKSNDISFSDISLDQSGTHFLLNIYGEEVVIDMPLYGRAYVYNAMVACAFAYKLGLSIDLMRSGLNKVEAISGRYEIIEVSSNVTVVNDAYNANPISMEMSIETFYEMYGESSCKRVLFLGEMKELGEVAKEEHIKLGELLKKFSNDDIYYIGEYAKEVGVKQLESWEQARDILKELISSDIETKVLLKGSNSIGLFKVLEY